MVLYILDHWELTAMQIYFKDCFVIMKKYKKALNNAAVTQFILSVGFFLHR